MMCTSETNEPMTSLVPQVDQMNREEVAAVSNKGETLSVEEGMKSESFRVGASLNHVVVEFWKILVNDPNAVPPFCMYSQCEDDSWNFSWGYDFNEESRRSCFYTIQSSEVIWCREYLNDVITLRNMMEYMNVACVIISDILQSHEWDKNGTARAFVANERAKLDAAKYQNRTK